MPIDMHYTHHPEELFDKPLEEQIVDLESAVLIEAHLQCAGQEMPLSPEDEKYFGPLMKGICESRLVKDEEGWDDSLSLLGFHTSYLRQGPYQPQILATSSKAYRASW